MLPELVILGMGVVAMAAVLSHGELQKARQDADRSFNNNPVGSTTQPYPCQKSITGRFSSTEVKCGDPVCLEADSKGIADGVTVSFAVRRRPGAESIATERAPLRGSQVRALEWTSQKPSNDWPRPEIDFQVSADGVSRISENQLNICRYADKSSETRTIPCSSGVFAWTGKFDIEFKDGVTIVTVKIKLINRLGPKPIAAADPMPAAGPPVSDADKQVMQNDIEAKLSQKWLFHRESCHRDAACDCPKDRKCCKFNVQVHIQFVEGGEHHTVNLFQGAGRANAANWTRVKTRDNDWAHEVGHLLAWCDESTGGAVGAAPRWRAPNAGAVMEAGLRVPAEYYWDFREWYASRTGESWKLLAP